MSANKHDIRKVFIGWQSYVRRRYWKLASFRFMQGETSSILSMFNIPLCDSHSHSYISYPRVHLNHKFCLDPESGHCRSFVDGGLWDSLFLFRCVCHSWLLVDFHSLSTVKPLCLWRKTPWNMLLKIYDNTYTLFMTNISLYNFKINISGRLRRTFSMCETGWKMVSGWRHIFWI